MKKNVFLVWTNYQARVENIIPDLEKSIGEIELFYRDHKNANKIRKLFNYILFFIADLMVLFKKKPKIVLVQTPPSFSLLAPIVYKFFFKKTKIVSDTHNAMTRPPWLTRVGTSKFFKYVDIVCVHNSIVLNSVINEHIFEGKEVLVLEDKTNNDSSYNKKTNSDTIEVFFPASFNSDEPILEVVKCAEENQDIKFTLTGNERKLEDNYGISSESLPSNLKITGWLTNDEYMKKLKSCDVLLGLTIFDDIQMSVSNEGLGAEKVMVLSNKKALKMIYSDAAIYSENNAEAIAQAIRTAYKESDKLLEKIKRVKLEKEARFNKQIRHFASTVERGG